MRLVVVDSGLVTSANRPFFVQTPFGDVSALLFTDKGRQVIFLQPPTEQGIYADPAVAYAARAMEAERVIAVARDTGVDGPATPADYIEFTNGRFTTFFSHVGTGYIQQDPPFCPQLRTALLAAGVADGKTLVILDHLPAPKEKKRWQELELNWFTTQTQPLGALCRELEMCFAVLALPPNFPISGLIRHLLACLPTKRECQCAESMAFARRSGKLPPDWRDWIQPAD